jgi:plastocyanin
MIKPEVKRSELLIIVLVAGILALAFLTQLGGRTRSTPVGSSTFTSASTTSLPQPGLTTSSSSPKLIPGLFAFSQYSSELFLTPSVTMNYTITISPLDMKVIGDVALSAVSPVSGVSVLLSPKGFAFQGAAEAIELEISVAPSVTSPTVPVNIFANTNLGIANQTFAFSLEKERIVVYPGSTEFAKPSVLHASAGQRVTWFDSVDIDDDGNGYVNIVLSDGSSASSTMTKYDLWSHTFDKPGTYTYYVTVLGAGSSSGSIVVG